MSPGEPSPPLNPVPALLAHIAEDMRATRITAERAAKDAHDVNVRFTIAFWIGLVIFAILVIRGLGTVS